MRLRDPLALLAGLAAAVALFGSSAITQVFHGSLRPDLGLFGLALLLVMAWSRGLSRDALRLADWLISACAVVLVATFLLRALHAGLGGRATLSFWAAGIAVWLTAWRLVNGLVAVTWHGRVGRVLVAIGAPLLFGATLVFLWEIGVRGAGVPMVILPAPSQVVARLFASTDEMVADFLQTFRGVAAGYAIGCSSGFLVALLIDRVPFLQRGLLPIGNLVSALPIVGIAPIMVMWFGFDWPSKAAVVVIMTFFPMLVNTNVGLAQSGAMERDLMKTYAAGYRATLAKLRLPAALPFLFNGLKLCSTLALIGAIVAEFFGTPIVGMGFRISAEVGRMNIDKVWATIVVAAVFGSAFYALIELVERRVTFWHASYRRQPA
jgi:NitT/TauT family transport system permease protein